MDYQSFIFPIRLFRWIFRLIVLVWMNSWVWCFVYVFSGCIFWIIVPDHWPPELLLNIFFRLFRIGPLVLWSFILIFITSFWIFVEEELFILIYDDRVYIPAWLKLILLIFMTSFTTFLLTYFLHFNFLILTLLFVRPVGVILILVIIK